MVKTERVYTLREKLDFNNPEKPGVRERMGLTDEEWEYALKWRADTLQHLRVYQMLDEGVPVTPEQAKTYLEFQKFLNDVHHPKKAEPGSVHARYMEKRRLDSLMFPEMQLEIPHD